MSLPPSTPASPRIVVDASVILAWYLPAERFKDAALAILERGAAGHVTLCVPTLTRFEVINVLALSARGITTPRRIGRELADEILDAFLRLPLEEHAITGLEQRILGIAVASQRSAYDAAYLALAERLNTEFVTGDAALFRAVRRRFPIRLLGS